MRMTAVPNTGAHVASTARDVRPSLRGALPGVTDAVGEPELRVDLERQVLQQRVLESCCELRRRRLHGLQPVASEGLHGAIVGRGGR